MTDVDILVLQEKVHGMDPEDYADAIRERLPDRNVVYAPTPSHAADLIREVPVVTGLHIDPDVVPDSDLRLFACVYAGTDHLPMDVLAENGVAVTNAAGVHAPTIAEYVVGGMLMHVQRFKEGWRRHERREWREYPTEELADSTVTVVGLGAIGRTVVDRLDAFDVETIGIRHSPEKGGPTDEVYGYDDEAGVSDAVARSDHLVLACPLTETTRHFVDDAVLKGLPPHAFLVNIARGPVVDTDALVETLQRNRVGGALLDVTDPEPLPPDHPLWGFDNVTVTPHNAGDTPEYWNRLADILAENVRHVEATGSYEDLRNQVA